MEKAKEAIIDEILRIKREKSILLFEKSKEKLIIEKTKVEDQLKNLNQQIKALEKKISDTQEQLEKEEKNLREMTFKKLGEILDNLYGETPETEETKKNEEQAETELPKEPPEEVEETVKPTPKEVEEIEPPEEVVEIDAPEEPKKEKSKPNPKKEKPTPPKQHPKTYSSPQYNTMSVAELSQLFTKRYSALESDEQKIYISKIFYSETNKVLGRKPASINEVPKEVFIKILNIMDSTAGGK